MNKLLTILVNRKELKGIKFFEYNTSKKFRSISDDVTFYIRIRTVKPLSGVSLKLSLDKESGVFFKNTDDYKSLVLFRGDYSQVNDGKEVSITFKYTSERELKNIKSIRFTTEVLLKHSGSDYLKYYDENKKYCEVISTGV